MGGNTHSKAHCPEPAEDKESYFQNAKGLWLWTKDFEVENPKALVFLSHGYGEYSTRAGYLNVIQELNKIGCNVYCIDHQGHGKSNGDRAHVEVFQDYINDFKQFIQSRVEKFPDLPRLIFGHSMGTLITLQTTIQLEEENPGYLRGIVLSACAIVLDPKIDTKFNRMAVSLLQSVSPKWIPPGIEKLNTKDLSRNPDAVKAYETDPLIYTDGFKVGHSYQFMKVCDEILKNLSKVKLPALIFHGTADKIANPNGSQIVYDNISSEDKKLKFFEEMFHELLEDPEKEKVFEEVITFTQRMATTPPQTKIEKTEEKPEASTTSEKTEEKEIVATPEEKPKEEKVEEKPEVKEETKVEEKPEEKEEVKEEVKEEAKEEEKVEEVKEESKEEKVEEEVKEEVKEEEKPEEVKEEEKPEEVKEEKVEEEVKEEVKEETTEEVKEETTETEEVKEEVQEEAKEEEKEEEESEEKEEVQETKEEKEEKEEEKSEEKEEEKVEEEVKEEEKEEVKEEKTETPETETEKSE